MSERNRLARLEFQRELDKEEAQKKAQTDRRVKELSEVHGQVLAEKRKWFLQPQNPELYVSQELVNARMAVQDAVTFNRRNAREFMEENPDFYQCKENGDLLAEYFRVNGIDIIDKAMLQSAYHQAEAAGLLKTGPDPEPESVKPVEPQPEPELERLPPWHRSPVTHKVQSQGSMYGRDLRTGEVRVFNAHEIASLSADDYRKIFELPSIDNLQFRVR